MSAPAERLLAWYDAVRRDLPWRRSRDPYRILVAEVMLQQTQVATVVPRYERFLERFPSVAALAAASEEEVLAAWSGLGYYRRARLLQRAAREIALRPEGFPRTAAELADLSGIGAYTAAAVASIAFGEATPVVDGNVARVVARRLAIAAPVARAAVQRQLHAGAAELLVAGRAGDSNQALMELGAICCRPRAPRCGECPLAADCAALERGSPEAFPVKTEGRPRERHGLLSAWVAREDGSVLLFRRGAGEAWLAGMWELPTVPADGTSEAHLGERYGGTFWLGERLGAYRHEVTFRALRVEVWRASWAGAREVAEGPEARWFGGEELAAAATSAMVAKARAVVAAREEA
jgi:A/G-specific adenine glycosylase